MFTYTVEIETLMGRLLVSPFSLTVNSGDKIALIGEEGNGKSVYLKALCNEESLVDLKVKKMISNNNIVFSYLSQELNENELKSSIIDYCIEGDWDLYPDYLSQMNLLLDGMDHDRVLSTLSGGERVKVQLVKTRMQKADCIIMDEPSNDLDLETLVFLEKWMMEAKEAILFVSHDRTLIERVAKRILHFEQTHRKTRHRLTLFEGSYQDYMISRNLFIARHNTNVENARKEKAKQDARWQKLYDNVSRSLQATKGNNPEKGRLLKKKMNTVKSMRKRLDKETLDDIYETEDSINIHFDKHQRSALKLLLDNTLEELKVGDRILGQSYQLKIYSKDKIACIGSNGCGKTSFLRKLLEEYTGNYGVMHQDYRMNLDYNKTPVENLQIQGSKEELSLIMLRLGNLKFTAGEMDEKTHKLSGGQKAKLSLLKLILQNPPLLFLDEPTRNLSPLTLEEIYKMLRDYEGAIFAITHDRSFIDNVFTKVVEMTKNGFIYHNWY